MRLLNIHSLQFQYFPSDEKPSYAITSHRWREEEISYQQFCRCDSDASIRASAGYKKILAYCEFLRDWQDGSDISWLWIDTCCIDKSSSAELTEAINSMYRWYADAWVCLAYLHDVPGHATATAELAQSEWFERGWTLQELLAPPIVVFLDKSWNVLGHKSPPVLGRRADSDGSAAGPDLNSISLIPHIASITSIDEDILTDYRKSKGTTLAQARSLMGDRRCTRVEDEAYCLLGICGIYMPLLYGERDGALERLEEEFDRKIKREAARTSHQRARSTEDERTSHHQPRRLETAVSAEPLGDGSRKPDPQDIDIALQHPSRKHGNDDGAARNVDWSQTLDGIPGAFNYRSNYWAGPLSRKPERTSMQQEERDPGEWRKALGHYPDATTPHALPETAAAERTLSRRRMDEFYDFDAERLARKAKAWHAQRVNNL